MPMLKFSGENFRSGKCNLGKISTRVSVRRDSAGASVRRGYVSRGIVRRGSVH